MNSFVLELWDDEGSRCTFYTVRRLGEEMNETDKFIERHYNHPDYKEDTQNLVSFILDVMGEDHGALDIFFNRHENEVDGLPMHGKVRLAGQIHYFPQFPLRLYALRLTEEIVVLFGGGIKDGPTNQESSLLSQWREACEAARKIVKEWQSEMIEWDHKNRKLVGFQGNEVIVIH